MAQRIEHLFPKQKIMGSNPIRSTGYCKRWIVGKTLSGRERSSSISMKQVFAITFNAFLAQLVERYFRKIEVISSILIEGSKKTLKLFTKNITKSDVWTIDVVSP